MINIGNLVPRCGHIYYITLSIFVHALHLLEVRMHAELSSSSDE